MRKHTRSRGLGRAGLVLAALASIATSQPDWHLQDSVTLPQIRLDTDQPEDMRHFSVRSSQAHSASVIGHVHWDDSIASPAAAVRVQIFADDGSLLREQIERVQDSVDEDGNLQEAPLHLGASLVCTSEPCEAGYGVKLSLIDGHPNESVRVDYGFVATIRGEGTHEPEDAFVTVLQD